MKRKIRIPLNLFLAAAVITAWIVMLSGSEAVLASAGLASLKWFTVLSNLMEAFASLVWLLACIMSKNRQSRLANTLKFIACVSTGLTFVTVMVFLGPLFGYASMFVGPNLWFHLLIPLLVAAEFVFLDEHEPDGRERMAAVAPMLLYGIFYLLNNIINGRGEYPYINDWYGFLTWGYAIGAAIFVIITGVTYLIGLVLCLAKRLPKRPAGHKQDR